MIIRVRNIFFIKNIFLVQAGFARHKLTYGISGKMLCMIEFVLVIL